jgi:multicomponent Na+:H+ antiporter subunit A
VYIVVVGLVLDVLRSLGAEIDEHFEERFTDPAGDVPDDEQDFAADAPEDVRASDGEPEGVPAETTSRGQA